MSLQVRLWATVGVIVIAGALVFLTGTTRLHEQVMAPFEAAQHQAAIALSARVVQHGAEAVDAATRASVNENVRGALKRGNPADAEAELLDRAAQQGAPTFAALVKPDGTVLGRVGADVPLEPNVKGLPVFADAATGVARDAVEVLGGRAYHLAAAPMYDGGSLAGVVLLGFAYDAAFADRMTKEVGAPVVLLIGNERLGTQLPDLSAEVLARDTDVGNVEVAPLPSLLPLLMPEHGRYKTASVPVGSSVRLVALQDRNQAFVSIAWAQALLLLGTLLIAVFQSALVVTTLRSVSKPIAVILDHLGQITQGGSIATIGILPEAQLKGPFLRLGKQVNMLLQLMPSVSRPGASPLGSLASSGAAPPPISMPPAQLDEPSFDGIPGIKDAAPPPQKPSLAPQTGPTPAAPARPRRALPAANGFGAEPARPPSSPPGAAGAQSGLANLFDDGAPDPLAAFRVQKPSQPAAQPPPQPPPPRQPEPEPEPEPAPQMNPEATVMFQVPQELLAQSAQVATNPRFPAIPKPADDARTVVAQVPQDLLSASAPRSDGINNADEAHYRDVYDKFVETRVQCGEDTSDLTYDRFVAKLLKNRQQIIEKHKAKSVRFQVYVKEGKAALRALPVRE